MPGPWTLNHIWNGSGAFLNCVLLVGFLWTREQGLFHPLPHPPSQEQDQTPAGCFVKDGQTQTNGWKGSPVSADPASAQTGFFFPNLHCWALFFREIYWWAQSSYFPGELQLTPSPLISRRLAPHVALFPVLSKIKIDSCKHSSLWVISSQASSSPGWGSSLWAHLEHQACPGTAS